MEALGSGRLVVVGSGPSGTNTALSLLKRGKSVELWDVGRTEEPFPGGHVTFHGLKAVLDDPQGYFLGENFEALIPPASRQLFTYPPSRRFIVPENDPLWSIEENEFKPILSFTKGGLGVGWGANALCYDDDDLRSFPVSFKDYEAAYREAFSRVPVAGPQNDDLSEFFPGLNLSQPPLEFNAHDGALYRAYERRATVIKSLFRIRLGKARMAVVTAKDRPERCRYCARCLWGCPYGSIYDPAKTTLESCYRYPQFRYRPDRLLLDLETDYQRVRAARFLNLATNQRESEPCDAVFLAAGAIQTGAIFLRTIQSDRRAANGQVDASRTKPLMDTHVVKIPYVQLRCVGKEDPQDGFQFNKLILGHISQKRDGWPRYVHGEILSLTSLLYHPLIESLPFGTRISKEVFFRLKPALGVVTLFFPDRPEQGNGLCVESDEASPTGDRIRIDYKEAQDKNEMIRPVIKDTVRALFYMGCLVPPGRIYHVPAGSGIHYAGTVPMGPSNDPLCVDARGRANAYQNLYIADGAAFPSLPSKSITMSLIAHAIRVADLAG